MQSMLLLLLVAMASSDDPPPVIFSGQVNIGLLADLRQSSAVNNGSTSEQDCGSLNPGSVQQALAAVWASQQINFRKEPQQFNIGVYIFDTCEGQDVAQRQLFRLVEQTGQSQPPGCIDRRMPPIFGAISQSSSDSVTSASRVLTAFGIPLVVTSSYVAEKLNENGNVLSTAPSSTALSRSIISILKYLRWSSVVLCSSDNEQQRHLAEAFLNMSSRIGLEVHSKDAHQGELQCEGVATDAWKLQSHNKVTLLFLEDQEAIELLRHFKPGQGKPPVIVATPKDISHALELRTSKERLQQLDSVLLVSPATANVPEYHTYFREALHHKLSRSSPLLSELSSTLDNATRLLEVDVSSTVKAVWALAMAVHDVQRKFCRPGTDCLQSMRQILPLEVLGAAKKMSHVIRQSGAMTLDGSGINFGEDGFLTTSRFSLKAPSAQGIIQEVAWYSDDSGLVLDEIILSSKDKLQGSTPPPTNSPFYSNQVSPSRLRSSSLSMPNFAQPSDSYLNPVLESGESFEEVVFKTPRELESWFAKPWGLVILSVCGAGCLLTMYVSVFLMMKICEGCVKRASNTLTFLQLVSLMMMFAGAVLFLFQPTTTCGLQRMVHNISFAFCFACLLLKSMYLHSTKSIGLGGRDSRLNQTITLLFAVGVQIAIEIQWWVLANPVVTNRTGVSQCFLERGDFLLSQSYIALLLSFSVLISFSTRNIPYSHREGQHLFITCVFCLPVFITWTTAYGMVSDQAGLAAVSSLGLIVTAFVVLGGIYGPMLYVIHKYGGASHKPLSYAESLSTVFTMFKDPDGLSTDGGTGGRGKKGAKTVDGPYMDSPEMVRNPLYDGCGSAYP